MGTAGDLRADYPHDARRSMVRFVPNSAKRLLDVGCNTGAFGEALKAQMDIEVWGIEPDAGAARDAARFIDKVINAPFNEQTPIPAQYFDAVVFNDVLEHLVNPWEALELTKRLLRPPAGCVIASIPNVRHIDNLVHLLRDRDFRYEPWGIRDRTHLRFFTKSSGARLFEESGYDVEEVLGIDPLWWTSSLLRRAAFRLFKTQLDDTKYIRFAYVARPKALPPP